MPNARTLDPGGARLTLTFKIVGKTMVINPIGEVDLSNWNNLRDALMAALVRPRVTSVVLDLNMVTFFGAAGLRAISHTHEEAIRLGIKFVLVVRGDSHVYRVLEIAGRAQPHTWYETRTQALADA